MKITDFGKAGELIRRRDDLELKLKQARAQNALNVSDHNGYTLAHFPVPTEDAKTLPFGSMSYYTNLRGDGIRQCVIDELLDALTHNGVELAQLGVIV